MSKASRNLSDVLLEARHQIYFAGVLVIISLWAFGLCVSLLLTSRNADIRHQASGVTRNAEVFLVSNQTPLYISRLSTLSLRFNPRGEAVDGIQVVLSVTGNDLEHIEIRFHDVSGLRRIWEHVEDVSNGKKISFAYITQHPSQPFVGTDNYNLLDISFVANKATQVHIQFDPGWTKANKHKEVVDVLRPLSEVTYSVIVPPATSPSIQKTIVKQTTPAPRPVSVTPTPKVTVSPSPTLFPSPTLVASPSPTVLPSPSISPLPSFIPIIVPSQSTKALTPANTVASPEPPVYPISAEEQLGETRSPITNAVLWLRKGGFILVALAILAIVYVKKKFKGSFNY